MEPRPNGVEPQGSQVELTTEAKLALHNLMGQVAMTITPGAVVTRLIANAANNVPLTPEWKAFRDGAMEVAEKFPPNIEP